MSVSAYACVCVDVYVHLYVYFYVCVFTCCVFCVVYCACCIVAEPAKTQILSDVAGQEERKSFVFCEM